MAHSVQQACITAESAHAAVAAAVAEAGRLGIRINVAVTDPAGIPMALYDQIGEVWAMKPGEKVRPLAHEMQIEEFGALKHPWILKDALQLIHPSY